MLVDDAPSAVFPTEEQLVCTLANSQVYVFTLSNTDILKSDEMNFELLSQAFHSYVVTGLDTCVRKPLVATCSTDAKAAAFNERVGGGTLGGTNYLRQLGELRALVMFASKSFTRIVDAVKISSRERNTGSAQNTGINR